MRRALACLALALLIITLPACKRDTKISEETVDLQVIEKAHDEYSDGSVDNAYIRLDDNGVDVKIQLDIELYDQINIGDNITVTKSLYKNDKESYYEYKLSTYTYNEHHIWDESKDNLQSTEKVQVDISDKYSRRHWNGKVWYTKYYVDFIDKENGFIGSESVTSYDYSNLGRGDIVYAVKKSYKTPKGNGFITYTLNGAEEQQ